MTPELALADDQWRIERNEQARIEREGSESEEPPLSLNEYGADDEVLRGVDPWHDCDWVYSADLF